MAEQMGLVGLKTSVKAGNRVGNVWGAPVTLPHLSSPQAVSSPGPTPTQPQGGAVGTHREERAAGATGSRSAPRGAAGRPGRRREA